MTVINNQNLNVSSLMNGLKEENKKMQLVMKKIQNVSMKSNILALNSGIEAARAGEAGRGFSVVAMEIKKFAEESMKASKDSEELILKIQRIANEVLSIRTVDIAFDTMDKIDRNLFERNCDVQAWATFDEIKNYLLQPDETLQQKVKKILKRTCDIYEVYHDIFLLDLEGNIVVAANNMEQVGKNMADREWFKQCTVKKEIHITDMYYSSVVTGHTMGFSASVYDDGGKVIGVLTSRFNWDFVYDIIDKVKIDSSSPLYLVNKEGYILASKDRKGILQTNLSHLKAVENINVRKENRGYVLENNHIYAYSLSEGYNSYKGKGWSIIVAESV